jgi:hypothetical protein
MTVSVQEGMFGPNILGREIERYATCFLLCFGSRFPSVRMKYDRGFIGSSNEALIWSKGLATRIINSIQFNSNAILRVIFFKNLQVGATILTESDNIVRGLNLHMRGVQ